MTPCERLSLAIHLESAAIAPQTSELIEAAKEVLRENEKLRVALEAEHRTWRAIGRNPALNQQLIPQKDGGLLSAAMTVLSECQDGPPSEQSICSLRDAVDAAIR